VPGFPVVPVLSIAFCGYLVTGLSGITFVLFAGWPALAAVLYVTYARTHSTLGTTPRRRLDAVEWPGSQ
jgi:APA family basic amino acid/polyamine antiporter